MKDLAHILSITPASTTSLVDGLVKMEALERIAHETDRRVVRLRATAKGRKQLADTDLKAKKELKKIFQELSDQDREGLAAVLEKLSRIISSQRSETRSPERPGEGKP
jgi:DNA-binding MarR family transcriptional regulator